MATRLNPKHSEEFFLPWFLSTAMRKKVEDLLPPYYQIRLGIYFDKYGCISCETKRHKCAYAGNGLCRDCYARITSRLRQTDRTMQRRFGEKQQKMTEKFLKRLTAARELLADLKAVM
jgi:hypothetical protein